MGIALWRSSPSLADVVMGTITAAATVAMAIMVKELDISLKQMKFEALIKVYDIFNFQEHKKNVDRACKYYSHELLVDCLKGNLDVTSFIRGASAEMNRVGYLTYRGFIDFDYIYDMFGGYIVYSFLCMRPLLICVRNTIEKEGPWFTRKFLLAMYKILEEMLRKRRKDYLENILRREYNGESLVMRQLRAYLKCVEVGRSDCKDFLPYCIEMNLEELLSGDLKSAEERIIRGVLDGKCSMVDPKWLEKDLLRFVKRRR
ncbi:hypothetical protein IPA_02285 [Ignicoccus pacificus DSM 13166]|uniref:Uncharacterized protein n=1 Tax=Ignicoccus pacificus DSM 13166 TaxID=940294 RepID=A0A977PLB8_9CREN|nr:hypothetical protein IPA_02285 [Ignicoccus pacificus DSM 13166]